MLLLFFSYTNSAKLRDVTSVKLYNEKCKRNLHYFTSVCKIIAIYA